jgi:CheY-like chemotaxis protein
MAALVAAFDWSSTVLGPRETWSPALGTIVGTVLASNHPMFIWWGPELIQFYNDAYAATMGPERHPSALGQAGRECWQEIWPIIGPQIESVMAGGPSTWHEDQLVPVTRHGSLQDVWWTYGYSPIPLGDGTVGGVLVVCSDVTPTHLAQARLSQEVERRRYANERQKIMFQQAPGFTCVLAGPNHVFEFANDAYNRLIGDRDLLGRPVVDVLPEAVDQGFIRLLDDVYASGNAYIARDLPLNIRQGPGDELTPVILDFVYHPIIESDGAVSGIFVQGVDVTQRKGAELALRAADRRKDEFLAMLAHELRNPLAPITAAAQVLELGQIEASAEELSVLVIGTGQRRYALVVDAIRGEHSLAVQALDPIFGKMRDISSAALLDDGAPVLILDVADLLLSIDKLLHEGGLHKLAGTGATERRRARRVLVVDDSLTVREMERKLLMGRGYQVDVAIDGMDGWNAVRGGDYDLVVTDVDMPRMDGIELVALIRKDIDLHKLPVMIVSYKDRPEDRARGMAAGADYYLTKGSFHDETLLDAVFDLIGDPRL